MYGYRSVSLQIWSRMSKTYLLSIMYSAVWSWTLYAPLSKRSLFLFRDKCNILAIILLLHKLGNHHCSWTIMVFLIMYAKGALMTSWHALRYSSMDSIIPVMSDLLIFGSMLGSLYSSSEFKKFELVLLMFVICHHFVYRIVKWLFLVTLIVWIVNLFLQSFNFIPMIPG